jgi:hypothetical protein
MEGTRIVLPPTFGHNDHRIFVVGPNVVQKSVDGGRTFTIVAGAPSLSADGSVAMKPGQSRDAAEIMIGSETLMQYRDDLRTVMPSASPPLTGATHPAYSPRYDSDHLLLVGGFQVSTLTGEMLSLVHRCDIQGCSYATIPAPDYTAPRVRFGPNGTAYAFTHRSLFVSRDTGYTFQGMSLPRQHELLADVTVTSTGELLVATSSPSFADPSRTVGSVYRSNDGGRTWSVSRSKLMGRGVEAISTAGNMTLAALQNGGVACSADGGRTWTRRCGEQLL